MDTADKSNTLEAACPSTRAIPLEQHHNLFHEKKLSRSKECLVKDQSQAARPVRAILLQMETALLGSRPFEPRHLCTKQSAFKPHGFDNRRRLQLTAGQMRARRSLLTSEAETPEAVVKKHVHRRPMLQGVETTDIRWGGLWTTILYSS